MKTKLTRKHVGRILRDIKGHYPDRYILGQYHATNGLKRYIAINTNTGNRWNDNHRTVATATAGLMLDNP